MAATSGAPSPAPLVVIHQFRPALGLQCFCRIAGIPYAVVNSEFPTYASTGALPAVQHGSSMIEAAKAMPFLRELAAQLAQSGRAVVDVDAHLAHQQAAQVVGLSTLVTGALADVVTWCHYGDEARYAAVTASALKQAMLAPLSWILPRRMKREAQEALKSRAFLEEAWVKEVAEDAYAVLGVMLKESGGPFLFGSRPTSLDALVFGHMCEVRTYPAGEWLAATAPGLLALFAHMRASAFPEEVDADGAAMAAARAMAAAAGAAASPVSPASSEGDGSAAALPPPPVAPAGRGSPLPGSRAVNVFSALEREATLRLVAAGRDTQAHPVPDAEPVGSDVALSRLRFDAAGAALGAHGRAPRGSLPFGLAAASPASWRASLASLQKTEGGHLVNLTATLAIFAGAAFVLRAIAKS